MKKLLLFVLALLLAGSLALAEEGAAPARLTCGDFVYVLQVDGTVCIAKYTGDAAELTIPAEMDGVPVTAIGDFAFSACRTLRRVVIPEGVRSLGASAFCSCSGLESVVLPEGLAELGDITFSWCTALREVNIPASVIRVGANPFYNCRMLTDMGLPEEHPVLAVMDGVLFDRVEMRLITWPVALDGDHYAVPEGTASIGAGAFYKCTLRSIAVPEGVTAIGDEAFSECRGLTRVTLPQSLVAIGEKTFASCRSLESLTLPAGVTEIGEEAFTRGPDVLFVAAGSYAEAYCAAQGLNHAIRD